MSTESLRNFLVEANKSGYASGEENKWKKGDDGSTTIAFESGEWRMHDNYFGGEPYGGREVIFHNNEPFWIMVYYGRVKEGVPANSIYPFLQKALSQMPAEHPYRGPAKLEEGNLRYENQWTVELDNFSGKEAIYLSDEEVYRAKYIGGLVDQRR